MELATGMIKIGTFNELYSGGKIRPYEKNRGGKIFDSKRVNKYASGWDTASSGAALLEKVKDGYVLRDFHNRAEAIKRGLKSGNIDPQEEILVRIVPPGDGLNCYRNINAANQHSGREKLTNTDLFYGNEISKIIEFSKTTKFSELPTKFFAQLSLAIVDLMVKKRSEFVSTEDSRRHITRWKDATVAEAQEVALSPNNRKKIAQAVDYYGTLRDQAIGMSDSASMNRIFSSAGFFGLTVYDFMYERKMGDVSKAAKNIVSGQRRLEVAVANLNHGTLDQKLDNLKNVMGILSK